MVDLRLMPTSETNMPKDMYVSVRVGAQQKLSRFHRARAIQLPQVGARFGRIEVFQRIGGCNIDAKPNPEEAWDVSIDCTEAGFGSLGFKVEMNDHIGACEGGKTKRNVEKINTAKEYLHKHDIEMRLSEAMGAVLRDRPEDPMGYLAVRLCESCSFNTSKDEEWTTPQSREQAPERAPPPPPRSPPVTDEMQRLDPVLESAGAEARRACATPPAEDEEVPELPEASQACGTLPDEDEEAPELPEAPAPAPEAPAHAATARAPWAAPFPMRPSVCTWYTRRPAGAAPGPAGPPELPPAYPVPVEPRPRGKIHVGSTMMCGPSSPLLAIPTVLPMFI